MVLFGILVGVDYATDYNENDTITVANQTISMGNITNATYLNGTHYVLDNDSGIAKLHKVVVEKPKYPLISMWAKPSVRSKYAYRWYYRTWVNYCPNCHRYDSLLKNPKGVPERELTCKHCDSDFCGVTGKEKMGYSHKYLRRA